MTHRVLLALLAAVAFLAPVGAAQFDSQMQAGSLATVRLLATGRPSGGGAPDGMQFLFLVTRGAGVEGAFSIKETTDFTVAGTSYQDETQAELGQRFPSRTSFEGSAEAFLSKQPGLRRRPPQTPQSSFGATGTASRWFEGDS